MNVVNKFEFNLDKERILKVIHSYFPWPDLNKINIIYYEMLSLLHNSVTPLGVYDIKPNLNEVTCSELHNSNYIVYCLITIGIKPTLLIDELFDNKELDKAVILDAMSSEYLFDISSQMFGEIYRTAKNLNMGLTCKIAPGDGEIELEFQETIVKKLYNPNMHDIKIVDKLMLHPSKSMSYIYGADLSIPFNRNDHSCAMCTNIYCCMRNVSKKIRGPF